VKSILIVKGIVSNIVDYERLSCFGRIVFLWWEIRNLAWGILCWFIEFLRLLNLITCATLILISTKVGYFI